MKIFGRIPRNAGAVKRAGLVFLNFLAHFRCPHRVLFPAGAIQASAILSGAIRAGAGRR